MKKIAVVCNYRLMPDRVGGMDRFFWLFDAECKKIGYDIRWFFPNKEVHGPYQNLTIMSANNNTIEESFLTYCKKEQITFDVVITHFVELCTPFFKEVKKMGVTKVIAVDHNPRPLEGYSLKKRMMKRIKGWLFARYIDLFIGVSAYTCKEMIKDFGNHIGKKTKVVYNGIEHQLYQKRVQRNLENPSFLVASHLRYSKGIQDLISAVSLLPDKFKEKLTIDMYGEGPYKQELKDQIIHHQLETCFTFKGSVPNLYEIYAQYDYLVQPTHMECFSLSILESLSANVPVITTAVGGNEEVIKDGVNGFIIQPQDIDALSSLIEQLCHGTKSIDQNTNVIIEQIFSIQAMVANHLQLLNI
ncbi:MAG: glycosyltransferase family 4 protein [Flavobacteriaceae bacterium]|nr:glycosyltransferase family 4 protein [Flavobacteriaceae bacterium]